VTVPPNMGMEPAPLRVDKIGRILETSSSSTHIPSYKCGAADGQSVGRQLSNIVQTSTCTK